MAKVNRYAIMVLGDSMTDTDGVNSRGYGPGRKEHSVWTKEFKKQIDPRKNQKPAARFKRYRKFELYQGGENYGGGSEMARSGIGTTEHLQNLPAQLKKTSPGIVVFAISPWNEAVRVPGQKDRKKLTISESRSNLEKLIAMARATGAKVLLVAFPASNSEMYKSTSVDYANKLAAMIKDVATQTKSAIVEDYYAPIRTNGQVPKSAFYDTLHLRYDPRREKRLFENVMSKMTPLMREIGGTKVSVLIDLEGNGLKFTSLANSPTQLDLDGDGNVENVAWTGKGTGFITFDHNGDGAVDAEDIFFGDATPGSKVHVLKAYDSNNDGVLDSADASWKKFAVWIDANANGVSDAGELKTLEQTGIKSIELTLDEKARKLNDVTVHGLGVYTGVDGKKRTLGTAQFKTGPDLLSDAEITRRRDLLVQAISNNGAGGSSLSSPGTKNSGMLSLSPVKF